MLSTNQSDIGQFSKEDVNDMLQETNHIVLDKLNWILYNRD